MKKLYVLLMAILLILPAHFFAQITNLTLPPYQLDVSTSSTLLNGNLSTTGQYSATNGVYDENNNPIFYLIGSDVFDLNNQGIGSLKPYYVNGQPCNSSDPYCFESSNDFEIMGREVSIVPIPGECQKFYIIYSMSSIGPIESKIMYMILDCTIGSSQLIPGKPTSIPYHENDNINKLGFGAGPGLAVSKVINSNQERYLFYGGTTAIYRMKITNAGIIDETLITADPTLLPFDGARFFTELELSPDQKYLSYGKNDSKGLFFLELNNYNFVQGSNVPYVGDISGVEFGANSIEVFISGTDGISRTEIGNNAFEQLINFGKESKSFIELAINGLMYGIDSDDQLFYFDPQNSIKISLPYFVNSNQAIPIVFNQSIYAMPDQIDGENYSYFFGVPIDYVDFSIEGNSNPSVTTNLVLCPNETAPIVNLSGTGILQYRIMVYNSDINKNQGSLINSTNFANSFPNDLSTYLPFPNDNYYLISIEGRNACGHIESKQLHICWGKEGSAYSSVSFQNSQNGQGLTCANPYQLFTCELSNGIMDGPISLNNYGYKYIIRKFGSDLCNTLGVVVKQGEFATLPSNVMNLGYNFYTNYGNYSIEVLPLNRCGIEGVGNTLFFRTSSNVGTINACFTMKVKVKNGQTFTNSSCTVPSNVEFTYTENPPSCSSVAGYNFLIERNNINTPNEIGRNSQIDVSGVNAGSNSVNNRVLLFVDYWDGTQYININPGGQGEELIGATTIGMDEILEDPITGEYAFNDPSITPDGTSYRLTVIVSNECGQTSCAQMVKLNTTKLRSPLIAPTYNEPSSFDLYPNPVNNTLKIDFNRSKVTQTISYSVLDYLGRKVLEDSREEILNESNKVLDVNVSSLVPGVYYIKITREGKSEMVSFYKK